MYPDKSLQSASSKPAADRTNSVVAEGSAHTRGKKNRRENPNRAQGTKETFRRLRWCRIWKFQKWLQGGALAAASGRAIPEAQVRTTPVLVLAGVQLPNEVPPH